MLPSIRPTLSGFPAGGAVLFLLGTLADPDSSLVVERAAVEDGIVRGEYSAVTVASYRGLWHLLGRISGSTLVRFPAGRS